MNPIPFLIEPTFSPRLWGSKSLAPLYPDKANLSEPIGEAWLTDIRCRVANGPFAGKTLADAWREMPVEWRGSNFAHAIDFPLLVKFIFPTEKLSIQVHPDDAYASIHEKSAGGRGKTEMWHIVSAEPSASLLLGLKPGVSSKSFLAALKDHTVETLFQSHSVHAGDTFFVPARTPHTIGANMTICEVQQYSDLTYRMYDYDRRDTSGNLRELHVEKSLSVTNFQSGEISPVPALQEPAISGEKLLLAACQYFATEKWIIDSPVPAPSHLTHFDLIVVLSGHGTLHSAESIQKYAAGQCWFIPAELGTYEFRPADKTSLLLTYVPNLLKLRQHLYRLNFSDEQVSRVIFE